MSARKQALNLQTRHVDLKSPDVSLTFSLHTLVRDLYILEPILLIHLIIKFPMTSMMLTTEMFVLARMQMPKYVEF